MCFPSICRYGLVRVHGLHCTNHGMNGSCCLVKFVPWKKRGCRQIGHPYQTQDICMLFRECRSYACSIPLSTFSTLGPSLELEPIIIKSYQNAKYSFEDMEVSGIFLSPSSNLIFQKKGPGNEGHDVMPCTRIPGFYLNSLSGGVVQRDHSPNISVRGQLRNW